MLRAAIIGTGRIASLLEKDPLRSKPHSHAGWYRQHPDTTLVAGADTDATRLEEFGRDWDLPESALYRDYRRMLDVERPDIVSICAWAPERMEMANAAVEAGARGLWIEKAVACSLHEATELGALLARTGVVAIVDHPRRTLADYRTVKRLIDEGDLGRLETVHCLMSGHLMHTGTHAWDMLDYWCGPWRTAQAWLEPPAEPTGPMRDTGGHARLVFDGGADVFVSAREKDYFIFQFDLVFERGRVQLGNDVRRLFRPAASERYTDFVELTEVPWPTDDGASPHPMIDDLVHALDTGSTPVMSVQNAIAAFRMGLALFQSSRERSREVGPDELDPSLRILSR
jgi:predicted dehydrogenase